MSSRKLSKNDFCKGLRSGVVAVTVLSCAVVLLQRNFQKSRVTSHASHENLFRQVASKLNVLDHEAIAGYRESLLHHSA